jgi:hypothetical protein
MSNILNKLYKIMDLLRMKSKIFYQENTKKLFQIKPDEVKVIRRKLIIWDKIKTFIYKLSHLVNYPFRRLKTFHQNILSIDDKVLEKASQNSLNPYRKFFVWLLDIIEYGLLISIPYNAIMGWQGWYNLAWIPAFGVIRYLLFDTIEEYRGTKR